MQMEDILRTDLKQAMKQRDKLKLDSIRLILKDFKEAEIAKQASLNDNEVIKIIEKAIKQSQETISDFSKVNNIEAIEKEQARIQLLESYLPKIPSESELATIIDHELKQHTQATISDLGKIMANLRDNLPARSNMKFVSEYLKSKLS